MMSERRYRNFEIGYEACYYVSTIPTKGSKGKSEVSELCQEVLKNNCQVKA